MPEARRPLTDEIVSRSHESEMKDMEQKMAILHGGASSTGMRAMRTAAVNASGVTLNTRVHPDLSLALKQACLQRKLNGIKPNTLRDIVEEAITPWLREHGYLP